VSGVAFASLAAGLGSTTQKGTEQKDTEALLATEADDDPESCEQVTTFVTACFVHLAGVLYITSLLAPDQDMPTYVMRSIAVFVSLVLYGWSLVAPKILTNRTFG